MSLKVQEQRRLIARRRTFWCPLSSSLRSRDDLGELDVDDADDPRRAFADLACGENAFDNQATHGRRTDREPLRRLVKRCLAALGALALSVDGDVVILAKGGHPRSRP